MFVSNIPGISSPKRLSVHHESPSLLRHAETIWAEMDGWKFITTASATTSQSQANPGRAERFTVLRFADLPICHRSSMRRWHLLPGIGQGQRAWMRSVLLRKGFFPCALKNAFGSESTSFRLPENLAPEDLHVDCQQCLDECGQRSRYVGDGAEGGRKRCLDVGFRISECVFPLSKRFEPVRLGRFALHAFLERPRCVRSTSTFARALCFLLKGMTLQFGRMTGGHDGTLPDSQIESMKGHKMQNLHIT